MPFRRGPQAQNEAQGTGREARLVRVRHDGGIEQRRGFEGKLVREISAQQQLPLVRGFPGHRANRAGLRQLPFEELADLRVAFAEFRQDLLQQRIDSLFEEP